MLPVYLETGARSHVQQIHSVFLQELVRLTIAAQFQTAMLQQTLYLRLKN